MIWLVVLIVIAVVLIGIVIALYNKLVRLRNRAGDLRRGDEGADGSAAGYGR